MHKFLLLTASAAVLARSGPALAQTAPSPQGATYPTAERASRGLDPAERETRRHAAFEHLDADRNGSQTYAEFAAPHHRSSTSSASSANHPQRGGRTSARGASALDEDSDGVVTREEYMAAMQRRFDRMDADHDGRLSLAERRPGARRAPAND